MHMCVYTGKVCYWKVSKIVTRGNAAYEVKRVALRLEASSSEREIVTEETSIPIRCELD